MKLELSVSKKHMNRASGYTEELVFTVVDLDKADYPLNFVCLLPKRLEKENKPSSKFLDIFGKESNQTAIKLLNSLLRRETDVAVKKEIEKRLKALQPMPTISAKCASCGCVFEPKKLGMFLQKTCQNCRSKNKSA